MRNSIAILDVEALFLRRSSLCPPLWLFLLPRFYHYQIPEIVYAREHQKYCLSAHNENCILNMYILYYMQLFKLKSGRVK